MKIRFSAHGAYHHQYHIVWIPKYRKKILKGELKKFIETRLFDIQGYHPDIEIEKYSIYVEFQEKVDKGQLQLEFKFLVPRA